MSTILPRSMLVCSLPRILVCMFFITWTFYPLDLSPNTPNPLRPSTRYKSSSTHLHTPQSPQHLNAHVPCTDLDDSIRSYTSHRPSSLFSLCSSHCTSHSYRPDGMNRRVSWIRPQSCPSRVQCLELSSSSAISSLISMHSDPPTDPFPRFLRRHSAAVLAVADLPLAQICQAPYNSHSHRVRWPKHL